MIINNIPWNPAAFSSRFQIKNWINNKATGIHALRIPNSSKDPNVGPSRKQRKREESGPAP
jgi:hypothetical protein